MSNWAISRRTMLRGLGVGMALPLLDAMMPKGFLAGAGSEALGAVGRSAPVRTAFLFLPNGMWMPNFTPATTGANFALTPTLMPLKNVAKEISILTGLALNAAEAHGDGPGDHARSAAAFLTGVHPKKTGGADIHLGVSVDQVAARAIGSQTRLPSLELGCDATRMVGSCDAGYSCAYVNSMSWKSATTPNPPETNPRSVFERIYGSLDSGVDPAARASVLDYVRVRTNELLATLAPEDRRKIDEYLTAIRDIEQRIARAEQQGAGAAPSMEKPAGVPYGFVEHVRLMHDLLIVALQSGVTRIATMIYAKEGSTRSYPELGFSDPHHPLTHHRNNEEWIEKVTRINRHHVEQFAYLVGRLKSIREGDATLLDNSMVVYGSSISDGNIHWHRNLPVVMLGRAGGAIKPGRHMVYPETPMTNLFLSMLEHIGVPTEKLGDSEGVLRHLSGV